jgi:succinate-semialdehyde dehydrogenase/glutarate-semialdehyde dehydrogenase
LRSVTRITARPISTAQSINPANDEIVSEWNLLSDAEAAAVADRSATAFVSWKDTSFDHRGQLLHNMAAILRSRKDELSRLAAVEMGKAVAEGGGEIEKCALICEYYAERAEEFLSPEIVTQEHAIAPLPGMKNYIAFKPMGTVFIIMPWNFPFWQVFRQAAPALSAGNTMLLKHASNVFGCANAMEEIAREAGFPEDVFRNLPISGSQASRLISHPAVKGVAVTGSTPVGEKVGAAAGGMIKPHVLELGGSDPYVILDDADIDAAAAACAAGRMLNCGQSCIGAKRFICVDKIHDEFLDKFSTLLSATKVGDPLLPETRMGPMVNKGAREEIHQQVLDSVAKGARIVTGGEIPDGVGAFYPPTVLADVNDSQVAYHEELFGPVASVIRAADTDQAIHIANDTCFGLGGAVFTRDVSKGEAIARDQIDAGLCFVNDFVKSHQVPNEKSFS